jgi:hypothetical protein
MKHDCCIGLYHEVDNSFLVTLDGLKREIEDTIYLNNIAKDEYGHVEGYERLLHKEYLLKEYADRRKSTNLTRFSYCPYCGRQIDWAALRKDDNKC